MRCRLCITRKYIQRPLIRPRYYSLRVSHVVAEANKRRLYSLARLCRCMYGINDRDAGSVGMCGGLIKVGLNLKTFHVLNIFSWLRFNSKP